MSDPSNPTTTLIVTAGTVIVAVIGVIGARFGLRRPVSNAAEEADVPAAAPSPLASFSGTQNEFMALVIKDNQDLRDQLADVQRRQIATDDRLATAERENSTFRRAVKVYLQDLAAAWPGPAPMPWPTGPDLAVLEQTLPRYHRPST